VDVLGHRPDRDAAQRGHREGKARQHPQFQRHERDRDDLQAEQAVALIRVQEPRDQQAGEQRQCDRKDGDGRRLLRGVTSGPSAFDIRCTPTPLPS
jgi:hypothetical protein